MRMPKTFNMVTDVFSTIILIQVLKYATFNITLIDDKALKIVSI